MYLGGRLVASVTGTVPVYTHTDALGSVVRRSDGAGNEVGRSVIEPFGSLSANSSWIQGPGFTGHVADLASGLTYMQQRYQDPIAMRFLSVDPVHVDTTTGGNFNRYWYANNNPYKFVDPDGNLPVVVVFIAKEIAGELFSEVTGLPVPTLKGIGRAAGRQQAVSQARQQSAPIRGRAQVTRSAGQETSHAPTSERLAADAARMPDTETVHLNQTVRTITDGDVPSSVRPDVARVRTDGRVDVDEVLSPGQDPASTAKKYSDALGERAGTIRCIPPDCQ